jgi:fatty acid desaturase
MLWTSIEHPLICRLGSQPKFEGNVTSLGSAASPVRIVRTGPRGIVNSTSEFSALLSTVRDAGLLRRRRRFYIITFAAISVAMGGAWVGFSFLHGSWYQLLIAAVLGVLFTQYAFLAHEASHRQVWESGKANDHTGRFIADLLVGISYSWWMSKHSRHHANPNTESKDPDIEPDFIMFQEKDAAALAGATGIKRFYAKLVQRQGWLLFPAMTLEGINLHRHAFITVFTPGKVDKRALEIVLLAIRNIGYLAVLFTLLPPGIAAAFLGVQLAVFGLYMGASFAPNHTGMPILPRAAKVDFLSRQVLTSRNIKGGHTMDIFMGGLNYQIEHHLFPSMARPHLKRASEIVREYCEVRGIQYTATTLPGAYGIVVRYLNKVGLSARDSFECPKATGFGV